MLLVILFQHSMDFKWPFWNVQIWVLWLKCYRGSAVEMLPQMKNEETRKKTHFLVHNEGSRSIADRGLPGTSHFLTLSVLEELEIQPETVCNSPLNLCNHVEEDTDGMATTDGVAELFEVVGKACRIHPLND